MNENYIHDGIPSITLQIEAKAYPAFYVIFIDPCDRVVLNSFSSHKRIMLHLIGSTVFPKPLLVPWNRSHAKIVLGTSFFTTLACN
jgi:hypothetical protein